jgi:PAS domain S-box-containing protein
MAQAQIREDTDGRVSMRWRWPVLVAIAVLLSLGALAASQYARSAGAATEVDKSNEVLDAGARLVTRLLDADAAYRGFLLTADRSFLQPYAGVANESRALLSRLDELASGSAERQASVQRLRGLAEQKLDDMARGLAAYDAGDAAAAIASLVEGRGNRTMEALRGVAADLRRAETPRLALQSEQARGGRRAAIALGIASVLVALSLAFVAISIERGFERRRLDHFRDTSARLAAQREAMDAEADLRQVESFNRSILNNSGDCIQLIEPDGRLVQMNDPGVALLDIDDVEAWRGQPWESLWGPAATSALHDATTKGEGRFHATRIGRADSQEWWDVIATPIRDEDGTVLKLVAIARDITEQHRAEEERAQLLASEQAARSEAERAARMKDEFVSTLSHELRTPLNAILGWVGVLKQDQSPETLHKALDVIDRNARRQSQMIDDLLDVSRIMSGKLRLDVQRMDLAPVIEEAVASAQPAADAKGVQLVQVLSSAATIQGDANRLQQVVWNLVTNAIKFTPRGGRVQVTLRTIASHVQVQVSDTGQGIRPSVLPYIFERFRQGDTSPTRQAGGLGLGLAIVKNVVEMHGGSVEAMSDGEGLGSTFSVSFPLAVASASYETPSAQSDVGLVAVPVLLRGVEALVLDDEPDARDLVERLLKDAGADVVTAASAHEALVQIEQGLVPDIILSDIGMPEQDGYQFMLRVRSMDGEVANVPAAALTALARVEDRKRALMAGYQTHLAKPVDPAELVAMVASLTGRTGGRSG